MEGADNDDVFSPPEWDQLLASKHMARIAARAPAPDGEEAGGEDKDGRWLLRREVLRQGHVVMCMAAGRHECAEQLQLLPGSCTVLLWRAWAAHSLEEVAQQAVRGLEAKLDAHTEKVAKEDIRAEVVQRVSHDMEQEAAALERAAAWNQQEVDLAVRDAIEAHHAFLDDIKSRMRIVIPKQMAQAHEAMEALRKEYNEEHHQTVHLSFAHFRHYSATFQQVFAGHFEAMYARNLKLKLAVENLDRCEAQLSAAKGTFSESKSAVAAAGEVCDSILKTIKAHSTRAEKRKADYAVLERELRIVQQRLEAEAEVTAQHLEALAAQARPVHDAISVSTAEQIKDIHAAPVPVNDLLGRMMDTVLIVLYARLDKVAPVEARGRKLLAPSWNTVLAQLASPFDFRKRLIDLDPDWLTAEQAELLQPYLTGEDFTFDRVRALANGACVPLFRWLQALAAYARRKAELAPKIRGYLELKASARALEQRAGRAAGAVDEAQGEVEAWRKMYDDAVRKRQHKEKEEEAKERNLEVAGGLIDGLKSQQRRWAKAYADFQFEIHKLAGNASVAAAFQAYLGPFSPAFRQSACEERLLDSCRNAGVMLKMPPTVLAYLLDDSELAAWRALGLPPDDACTESALLAARSPNWPLLVDPHGQAKDWAARRAAAGAEGELKTVHVQDEEAVGAVQACVSFGIPLLLEGVDGDLPWDLGLLLDRPRLAAGHEAHVTIEGKRCEYSGLFSLCMVTARLHPHYSEEFASCVSVVSFAASEQALATLMLQRVLEQELPAEAAARLALLAGDTESAMELKRKQVALLELFAGMDGSLVDSAPRLDELAAIKSELAALTRGREDAKKRWAVLAGAVKEYGRVGQLGAQLLEAVTLIGRLHPMYHTSMPQFLALFSRALADVPPPPLASERVPALLAALPLSVFTHVSGGLAAGHRGAWRLLLALRLDLHAGGALPSELDAVLAVLAPSEYHIEPPAPAPAPADTQPLGSPPARVRSRKGGGWPDALAWMSVEGYVGVKQLERNFRVFTERQGATLTESLVLQQRRWQAWLAADEPEGLPVPLGSEAEAGEGKGLRPVEQLALVRWLRFDRFAEAARRYVEAVLGPRFLAPAAMDVEALVRASSPLTPVLLLLAPGFSVLDLIHHVARRRQLPVRSVALGHGQRALAQKLMLSGPVTGQWLVLENGHLDLPYLATLPPIIRRNGADYAHEQFRLFVTTELRAGFPATLAEMAVRQSAEPPEGFKGRLWSSWRWMSPDALDAVQEPEWGHLVYALCFLHALVNARARFAFRGWAAPVAVPRRELVRGLAVLEGAFSAHAARAVSGRFLMPWQTMQQLASEALLGAAVTDPHDQLLLDTYLQRCLAPRLLQPDFEFAPGYRLPLGMELPAVQRHVLGLPDGERAALFGLGASAEVFAGLAEAGALRALAQGALQRGERQAHSEKMSSAELHAAVESILRAGLPRDLDARQLARESLQHQAPTAPMHLMLMHEVARLHQLSALAQAVLRRLRDALAHGCSLGPDEQAVAAAVKRAAVPAEWEGRSWHARSLTAWLEELNQRSTMLQLWARNGRPCAVWIGGLLSPAAFLRHVLQEQCRARGWALDRATLTFEPDPEPGALSAETAGPARTHVSGVLLAGASFDCRAGKLVPAGRERLERMPDLALVAREGPGPGRDAGGGEGGFRAPWYGSTRAKRLEMVAEVTVRTDLAQQQLVLSRCAFFCRNDSDDGTALGGEARR